MTERLNPTEHRLFDAACTDRLDDASRDELQQLLRSSPEARRRYLDYTALHADLFGAVRVARVRDRFAHVLDAEGATVAPAPSGGPRPVASAAWVAALATAAALALTFLPAALPPATEPTATGPAGEALAVNGAEETPTARVAPGDEPDDGEVGRWRGLVARINRVEAVEWEPAGQAFAEADLLAAGESVALLAGLVEVEFRQGAVVVLEGPAHLIAEDANGASLLQGKLAAVAPPWATGFRVDTPGVDVVDHGTEFAVNVTGDGSDARVNVVVTEGEVEVLADQQAEGGRRLKAGEGVQSAAGAVEDGDDAAARQLTEQLPDRPEFKNGIVVGDRWADWTVGVDGEPCRDGSWRYYTNGSGKFGDPDSYQELVWDASTNSYRPANRGQSPWLNKFVRVHRDGGHPGKGRDQVWDKFDRYSITGFVVPEDGVYRLEAGWLERLWARRWDRDGVLDIAVHVNDGPILMREFCNRESFVAFRQALGELAAGDTIYVGVGPNGTDFNDKFRWGFYVVRETGADEDPLVATSDLAAVD